jgi:hypothetical protein
MGARTFRYTLWGFAERKHRPLIRVGSLQMDERRLHRLPTETWLLARCASSPPTKSSVSITVHLITTLHILLRIFESVWYRLTMMLWQQSCGRHTQLKPRMRMAQKRMSSSIVITGTTKIIVGGKQATSRSPAIDAFGVS